jgi:hypothetical protein
LAVCRPEDASDLPGEIPAFAELLLEPLLFDGFGEFLLDLGAELCFEPFRLLVLVVESCADRAFWERAEVADVERACVGGGATALVCCWSRLLAFAVVESPPGCCFPSTRALRARAGAARETAIVVRCCCVRVRCRCGPEVRARSALRGVSSAAGVTNGMNPAAARSTAAGIGKTTVASERRGNGRHASTATNAS